MCGPYYLEALEHSAHIRTKQPVVPRSLEAVKAPRKWRQGNGWTDDIRMMHSLKMKAYWKKWHIRRAKVQQILQVPEAAK